jgi:hypothetical protein
LVLTEVWQQNELEHTSAHATSLNLAVSAHFHSGQKQIMMVLDQQETRRLGDVLPDLGAAIQAGETWGGKEVLACWGAGRFKAKLVHHKDNGNVKFTLLKSKARTLWNYLDKVLRTPSPLRRFSARYTIAQTEDALDEFFVNFSVPDDPS